MPTNRERVLVIGSVVVILLTIGWWIYWQGAGRSSSAKINSAIGVVLADNAESRLGRSAKLLVLVARTGDADAINRQERAFQAEAKRRGLNIIAVETLDRYELSSRGPQMGFAGERYLALRKTYRDVHAIVSFVGVPQLDAKQLAGLPSSGPRLLAVSRTRSHTRELLASGRLELVIVPRFKFPAPLTGQPRTDRQWFDKYQQIVSNVADLPPVEESAR